MSDSTLLELFSLIFSFTNNIPDTYIFTNLNINEWSELYQSISKVTSCKFNMRWVRCRGESG